MDYEQVPHDHMLLLLSIMANERNTKPLKMSWNGIKNRLNSHLNTNYSVSSLKSVHQNQYELCRDYYVLQGRGFNIWSRNDNRWADISEIAPKANQLRRVVREGLLCLSEWNELFGENPKLPMACLHYEVAGRKNLVLWTPSEGGRVRSGGTPSILGGSSNNVQTVNLCDHKKRSSATDISKVNAATAALNDATARIEELTDPFALPSKFYILAVGYLAKNMHLCSWVSGLGDADIAEWIGQLVEDLKPHQGQEIRDWIDENFNEPI